MGVVGAAVYAILSRWIRRQYQLCFACPNTKHPTHKAEKKTCSIKRKPQCRNDTAMLSRKPSLHVACPSMAHAQAGIYIFLPCNIGFSSSGKETTAGVPPPRLSACKLRVDFLLPRSCRKARGFFLFQLLGFSLLQQPKCVGILAPVSRSPCLRTQNFFERQLWSQVDITVWLTTD